MDVVAGVEPVPVDRRDRWDVKRLKENNGPVFYGTKDPEKAAQWLDDAEGVLELMKCPSDQWVRIGAGAMAGLGRDWWRNPHGLISMYRG